MNKIYRLKFKRHTRELVVVSENTKGVSKEQSSTNKATKPKQPRTLGGMIASGIKILITRASVWISALFGVSLAITAINSQEANANLLDGKPITVIGDVKYKQANKNLTEIRTTGNSVINWQSFNIGKQEIVNFIQQNSSNAVLNRVVGNQVSHILGALKSNGHVFIINPNGIVFGKDSTVNVSGLIASTLDISDQDFVKGKLNFEQQKKAAMAAILNQGLLSIDGKGNLMLIGGQVTNQGVLRALNGSVYLLAGQKISIGDINNPSINYVIAAGSKAVNLSSIFAKGKINLVASQVENTGSITATDKNGVVELFGEGGDSSVYHSGSINAHDINIQGKNIAIDKFAQIHANANTQDSGHILIGANQDDAKRGKLENFDLGTGVATNGLSIAQGSKIFAQAVANGKSINPFELAGVDNSKLAKFNLASVSINANKAFIAGKIVATNKGIVSFQGTHAILAEGINVDTNNGLFLLNVKNLNLYNGEGLSANLDPFNTKDHKFTNPNPSILSDYSSTYIGNVTLNRLLQSGSVTLVSRNDIKGDKLDVNGNKNTGLSFFSFGHINLDHMVINSGSTNIVAGQGADLSNVVLTSGKQTTLLASGSTTLTNVTFNGEGAAHLSLGANLAQDGDKLTGARTYDALHSNKNSNGVFVLNGVSFEANTDVNSINSSYTTQIKGDGLTVTSQPGQKTVQLQADLGKTVVAGNVTSNNASINIQASSDDDKAAALSFRGPSKLAASGTNGEINLSASNHKGGSTFSAQTSSEVNLSGKVNLKSSGGDADFSLVNLNVAKDGNVNLELNNTKARTNTIELRGVNLGDNAKLDIETAQGQNLNINLGSSKLGVASKLDLLSAGTLDVTGSVEGAPGYATQSSELNLQAAQDLTLTNFYESGKVETKLNTQQSRDRVGIKLDIVQLSGDVYVGCQTQSTGQIEVNLNQAKLANGKVALGQARYTEIKGKDLTVNNGQFVINNGSKNLNDPNSPDGFRKVSFNVDNAHLQDSDLVVAGTQVNFGDKDQKTLNLKNSNLLINTNPQVNAQTLPTAGVVTLNNYRINGGNNSTVGIFSNSVYLEGTNYFSAKSINLIGDQVSIRGNLAFNDYRANKLIIGKPDAANTYHFTVTGARDSSEKLIGGTFIGGNQVNINNATISGNAQLHVNGLQKVNIYNTTINSLNLELATNNLVMTRAYQPGFANTKGSSVSLYKTKINTGDLITAGGFVRDSNLSVNSFVGANDLYLDNSQLNVQGNIDLTGNLLAFAGSSLQARHLSASSVNLGGKGTTARLGKVETVGLFNASHGASFEADYVKADHALLVDANGKIKTDLYLTKDLKLDSANLTVGNVKASDVTVAFGSDLNANHVDATQTRVDQGAKLEAQVLNSTNLEVTSNSNASVGSVNVDYTRIAYSSELNVKNNLKTKKLLLDGSNVSSFATNSDSTTLLNSSNLHLKTTGELGDLTLDNQSNLEVGSSLKVNNANLYSGSIQTGKLVVQNGLDLSKGKVDIQVSDDLQLVGKDLKLDGQSGSSLKAKTISTTGNVNVVGGADLETQALTANKLYLGGVKGANFTTYDLKVNDLTVEGRSTSLNIANANIVNSLVLNNTYQAITKLQTGSLLLKNAGLSAQTVNVNKEVILKKGSQLYASALTTNSIESIAARVESQNLRVGTISAQNNSVLSIQHLKLSPADKQARGVNRISLDNSILRTSGVTGGDHTVVDLTSGATFNAQTGQLNLESLNVKDSSSFGAASVKAKQVNLDGFGSSANVEGNLDTDNLNVQHGATLDVKKDLTVESNTNVINGNLDAGSLKTSNLQADSGAEVNLENLLSKDVTANHGSSITVKDSAKVDSVKVLNKSTFNTGKLSVDQTVSLKHTSSANLGTAKVGTSVSADDHSNLKAASLTTDSLSVDNSSTAAVKNLSVTNSTLVSTQSGLSSTDLSSKNLQVTEGSNLDAGKVATHTTTIKDNSTAKVTELQATSANLKDGAKVDLGSVDAHDLSVSGSAVTANEITTKNTTVDRQANLVTKDLTASDVTSIVSGKVVVKDKLDTAKLENNGELQADKIKLKKLNLGEGKTLSSNELSAQDVTLQGNANLNVNKLNVDQDLLVTTGSQVNAQSATLNQAKVKQGGTLKADDITASSGIYVDSGSVSASTINTNELGASVNSQVAATSSIKADTIMLDNSALNSASLSGKKFTSVGAQVSAGQSVLGTASISSSNVNSNDLNVIYLDLNQGSKLVSNKVVASQVTINNANLEAAILQVDNGLKLENAANLKASEIVGADIQIEKSKLSTNDLTAQDLLVGVNSDVHVANQLTSGTLKTHSDLKLNDVKADAIYLENGNKVSTHNLVASDVKVSNGSTLKSNDITTDRFKVTEGAQVQAHNLEADQYLVAQDKSNVQVSNLKTGRLAVDNSFVTVDNQATTSEANLSDQAVLSANRVTTSTLHLDNSTMVVNSLDATSGVDLTNNAGLKVRDHLQANRLSTSDSVVRSAADVNKFNSITASNSTLVLIGQTDTTSAKLDHSAIYGTEGELNVAGHAELANHSAVEVGSVSINNLYSEGNNALHAFKLNLTGGTSLKTTEVKARKLEVNAGYANFEADQSAISVTQTADIKASSVTLTDSVLLGDEITLNAQAVDLHGKTRVLAGNLTIEAHSYNFDDSNNIKADNVVITCDLSNSMNCQPENSDSAKGSISGDGSKVDLSTAKGDDSSSDDSSSNPSEATKEQSTVSSSSSQVAEAIKTAITATGTGSGSDDSTSSGTTPVVSAATILNEGSGSGASGSSSSDDGIFSDTAKQESAKTKADKEQSLADQSKAKEDSKTGDKSDEKDDKDKKDRKDKDSEDSSNSTTSENGTIAAQNVSPIRSDIENIADNLGLTSAINKAVAQVDKQVTKTINNAVNTAVAGVNNAVDSVQRSLQKHIDQLQKAGVAANALPYGQSDQAFTAVTTTNIQNVFSTLRTQEAIAAKAKVAPVTVKAPKVDVPTVIKGIGKVNAVVSNGINNAQVADRVSESNIPGFYSVNRSTKEYTYNLQYGNVQLSCERGTMQGVSATCVQVPSAESNPGNVVSGLSSVQISGK